MSWLKLSEIATMVGGTIHGNDITVNAVSIDTRTMGAGSLYVALKGERYDGHEFINEARNMGAVATMTNSSETHSLPCIVVEDPLQALSNFAKQWRSRLRTKVIALTGSNGKTTTKSMLALIMELCCKTVATKGTLNNHIGVPLTVLQLREGDQCAVVEMGANHAGEISALCAIAQPDFGAVLNAGDAHIEGFGSLDGVASAKGEMYESLSDKAIAIFNRDDPYYDYWKKRFSGDNSLQFGFSQQADISATISDGDCCELRVLNEKRPLRLKLLGGHNVTNAMAAACIATAAGADIDSIIKGLEKMTPPPGRMVDMLGISGMSIIDDTYNANPVSLQAALNVLQERSGRRWLALGNMEELGQTSEAAHITAALNAKAAGVEHLLTIGQLAHLASKEFGKGGIHFDSIYELASYLKGEAAADICLLVKGSRSTRMERLVNALTT